MAFINVGGKVVNDPLKASDWNSMYDNFAGLANGDPGAPEITQAAMDNNSIGQAQIISASVGQGELRTALQQSTAFVGSGSQVDVALTGGLYSLNYTVADDDATQNSFNISSVYAGTTYGTSAGLFNEAVETRQYYLQCRYITATKPYNIGHGDIGLFAYALVDSITYEVLAVDVAEDAPWYYNGPNRIDPRKVKTIKGYKYATKQKKANKDKKNMDAYWDSIENPVFEDFLIDNKIKNQDMNIIPHPFMGRDLTGKSVVLLDPTSALNDALCCIHEDPSDDSVADMVMTGDIIIDRNPIDYTSPNGVIVCSGRKR